MKSKLSLIKWVSLLCLLAGVGVFICNLVWLNYFDGKTPYALRFVLIGLLGVGVVVGVIAIVIGIDDWKMNRVKGSGNALSVIQWVSILCMVVGLGVLFCVIQIVDRNMVLPEKETLVAGNTHYTQVVDFAVEGPLLWFALAGGVMVVLGMIAGVIAVLTGIARARR